MRLSRAAVAAVIIVFANKAAAQVPDSVPKAAADTMPQRTFGGFVDTYYAWDFDRPHNFDRAYTTQPARHAEFNVNLAYIETKWSGPRYRGRLALQWGTSVQANYAGEPKLGSVSGPNVSQFIQEASVGYQLGPTLWLDAGIIPSHLGLEGWISRDNLAYTRSLVADFSPYYEAGTKLTWTPSSSLTGTFLVINGWQDVSNYNTPPAAGVRVDYAASPTLTLSYDNFIGNAAADSLPVHLRVYHDVIAQYNPSALWQFAANYALGSQSRSTPSGGTASWWGITTLAKYHATTRMSVVGRIEYYSDPSQVIVATGVPASFQTAGASIGTDVNFVGPLLWRTELRSLRSRHEIWPLHTAGQYGSGDAFVVSSFALTF